MNFFDEPIGPKATTARSPTIEPPPPSSEQDYGNIISFPHGEQMESPALWHAQGEWNEADIPRRPWIVPGYAMRGAITLVIGAPSAGKSSILKSWAVACALGRSIHRFRTELPIRVLSYNVEDDLHEERRRLSATLRHFRASPSDIADTMRLLGPYDIGILLRRDAVSGVIFNTSSMQAMIQHIEEYSPDILFCDPLVELHNVEENDNIGLRGILAMFRQIAIRYAMAIVIVHHVRKGAITPGDPDAARGAGSIVGAARIVYTVCAMTEDEAGRYGLTAEQRRYYFRLDSAKQNYASINDAEWFERRIYTLDNGEDVAAAVPWTPSTAWDTLTWETISAIFNAIEAGPAPGEYYAMSRQAAERWAGRVICELGNRTEQQAAEILKKWLDNGVLEIGHYISAAAGNRERKCIRVVAGKAAGMMHAAEMAYE